MIEAGMLHWLKPPVFEDELMNQQAFILFLENITRGTRQMAQLIDDLLHFSRSSRQPIVLNLIPAGKLMP
jgi:light-regulated signal transduction histidine kinase (bacteriophytochrome)